MKKGINDDDDANHTSKCFEMKNERKNDKKKNTNV